MDNYLNPSSGFRLLIADDEQLEREAIRLILQQNFPEVFEIGEAANGRETLEMARSFRPEIIFLDIKMPGISGLQAAAQINELLPNCRIIIVTAYHYFNYAQEAVSLGVVDYITKPAPEEIVVATVRRVMAGIEEERAQKQLEAERERRLKQITQYFEDDILVLIASGEIDERVIEEYFELLNVKYQGFLAVVAAVYHQNQNEADVSDEGGIEIDPFTVKKRLTSWLKSYFRGKGYPAFIRSIGQEIYLLLLLKERLDEYQSRLMGMELFAGLKEPLAAELKITLSVGIGSVCNSAPEIYPAFLQAKNALRYETDPGSIFSYGDIQGGDHPSLYPVHKEKKLLQSMLEGNQNLTLQLLDEILEWLFKNSANSESFRKKVSELLLTLIRGTVTHTNLAEFDAGTEDLYRQMNLLSHQEEIRLFARDYFVQKFFELNAIKTSRSKGLLNMAIGFMEQNFQKELSLEEVASRIQISPFYLSKIFKKELHQNFIDYLTGIRVQKAKELLASPLLTIKEICFQVGYKDPNYFARVFKKTCGMTPTEYQAKHCGIQ